MLDFQNIGLLVLVVIYFMPIIVADKRKHPNRLAISWLCLLLGWTFIFWVIALVWSLMAFVPPQQQYGARGASGVY